MPTNDLLICHSTFWLIFIKRHVLHFTEKQKRLPFPNHHWTEWTNFTMTTQQLSCENKAFKVSNLRCGWSCQAISVTSMILYDPRLERIRCMKSRQSLSRLTRPAGVWGSRDSHSRITLTALHAFRNDRKRLFCSLWYIEPVIMAVFILRTLMSSRTLKLSRDGFNV